MQIEELFVSQRKLRNVNQLAQMIESIKNEEYLPRIEILSDEFGNRQVNDGHHRLVAYWLSGRRALDDYEYLLIETEKSRARFGRVSDLILRCMMAAG